VYLNTYHVSLSSVVNVCALQWDPMITTLPGLYLMSVALVKPINWAIDVGSVACTTLQLRSVNVFLAVCNLCLLWKLTETINKEDTVSSVLVFTLWLSSFFCRCEINVRCKPINGGMTL
jgi:DIE2/ALG10 family